MAKVDSCPTCQGRDRDLYAIAALFWVVSLARVLVTWIGHEPFGTEASLAALFVIVVPWVLAPRLGLSTSMRVR